MSDGVLHSMFAQDRAVLRSALREALELLDDLNSRAPEEWLTDQEKAANNVRMQQWEALLE